MAPERSKLTATHSFAAGVANHQGRRFKRPEFGVTNAAPAHFERRGRTEIWKRWPRSGNRVRLTPPPPKFLDHFPALIFRARAACLRKKALSLAVSFRDRTRDMIFDIFDLRAIDEE